MVSTCMPGWTIGARLGSAKRTLGGHGYLLDIGPPEASGERLRWISLACSLARSSTSLRAAFSAAAFLDSLDSLPNLDSLPDMDSLPSPPPAAPAAAAFSWALSRALLCWSSRHLSLSLALIPTAELLPSAVPTAELLPSAVGRLQLGELERDRGLGELERDRGLGELERDRFEMAWRWRVPPKLGSSSCEVSPDRSGCGILAK